MGYMAKKKSKKGGSIASNRVMSLVPKLCTKNFPYPSSWKSNITSDFISKNYGIEYKTTGGKKKSKKQKGGEKCDSIIGDWGDQKVNDPSPPKDIPPSLSTKLFDQFLGDKCYQCKSFPRSSPISQEFKTDPPQALTKSSFNNPGCKTSGFSQYGIQPETLTLYPPLSKLPPNNEIPFALAGGKKSKKSKKSKKNKKMIGSGSDWMSSVYSRGAYNAPNMDKSQFKLFNKTAPYISNIKLADGAAKDFKESKFIPAPALEKGNNPPLAFNELNGVSTNKFNGGKKKAKKKQNF